MKIIITRNYFQNLRYVYAYVWYTFKNMRAQHGETELARCIIPPKILKQLGGWNFRMIF